MKTYVHWFRKGLRLHDNPALLEICKTSDRAETHLIYIFDELLLKAKNSQNRLKFGLNRLHFLIECLADLDKSLRELGSRLYVFKGDPTIIVPAIVKLTNATLLTFETDTEEHSLKRDDKICKLLSPLNCEVKQFDSHTLFKPSKFLKESSSDYEKSNWPRGIPPLTYNSFLLKSGLSDPKSAEVGVPVEKINELPHCRKKLSDLLDEGFKEFGVSKSEDYIVPNVEDLGFRNKKITPFKGGETVALMLLDSYIRNKDVSKFEKPKTEPTGITPNNSTTTLSAYLALGCLSSRLFHQKLFQLEDRSKSYTKPPVSLRGQLYWREFFYCCAYAVPNFDKMNGNPICLQIDWDCSKRGQSNTFLEAWTNAKTGFPWIDAVMTQLREEGWIHHLARHAVACFLTRGDMYISWERGAEVFEELLVDIDWSINNANWMWLSASAFFNQYFRVYSPISFPKKTDKNGDYVRHYLPILKNYPKKYIYEPWKCPFEEQKKYGCIIGKDYPKPILDHEQYKAKNIERIKRSYQAHLLGNTSETKACNKKQKKDQTD